MEEDTKIAEALLAYEPELLHSVDSNEMIPLHLACGMKGIIKEAKRANTTKIKLTTTQKWQFFSLKKAQMLITLRLMVQHHFT